MQNIYPADHCLKTSVTIRYSLAKEATAAQFDSFRKLVSNIEAADHLKSFYHLSTRSLAFSFSGNTQLTFYKSMRDLYHRFLAEKQNFYVRNGQFCVMFRHENGKAIAQMVPSAILESLVKDN